MRGALALILPVALLAACEQEAAPPESAVQTEVPEELQQGELPVQPADEAGIGTPMEERVATLGLLNKRNNVSRDLELRPGQQQRVGDVIVRLQACERTAPWEMPKETGAFVQLLVKERGTEDQFLKVFSGWLFKNSPSLNVVEHPIYDVWVKDYAIGTGRRRPTAIPLREATRRVTFGLREQVDIAPVAVPPPPFWPMFGHELAVEQRIARCAHRRDQPGERHLARIVGPAEHAFAAEHAIEAHAVKPADQFAIAPAFDRMRMAGQMQRIVTRLDPVADPAFGMFFARGGAFADDLVEGGVAVRGGLPQPLRRTTGGRRRMIARSPPRPADPLHPAMISHGKYSAAICAEQQFDRDSGGGGCVHYGQS